MLNPIKNIFLTFSDLNFLNSMRPLSKYIHAILRFLPNFTNKNNEFAKVKKQISILAFEENNINKKQK